MIPKIIHYCWFGKSELPQSALACMASWKKFCPDYEIKRWDESNFDVNVCAYVKDAYERKKYAFVSDYARFWILFREGGVYMDTDVELLKELTPFLQTPFMGFETPNFLNPGLCMGAEKGDQVCFAMLDSYEKEESVNEKFTVCDRITAHFTKLGFELNENADEVRTFMGYRLYPPRYFNPMGEDFGKLNITDDTVSIHHFDASWKSPDEKLLMEYRKKYGRKKGTLFFSLAHPFKAVKKARSK